MMAEAGAFVIQALAMEHSMTLLLMVMRLSLSLQKEYMALLMEVEVGANATKILSNTKKLYKNIINLSFASSFKLLVKLN